MPEEEFLQVPSPQASQIDIKRILLRYRQHWYLFVASVILCVLLALIYLRYATPQYSVNSTLLIKDAERESDLFSASTVFEDLDIFQSTKKLENEVVILKSISLMQRVLKELSLYTSYHVEGRIKNREVYGRELPLRVIITKLTPAAFGKSVTLHLKGDNGFELEEANGSRTAHQFGQQIEKPYGIFTVVATSNVYTEDSRVRKKIIITFNDIEKLAEEYNKILTVDAVNKKASIVVVGMVDPVKEKARDIVNKLIEVYKNEAREDKNLLAANTIQFIDERLEFLTSELTAVEKEVEKYKRQNEVTNVSSEASMYLERTSTYNRQLAELEIQIDVLESIEGYLTRQQAQFELVPSTLNIQDPTLIGLITKFNELQLERERTLRTTQPNNPLVLNINEQLSTLRNNILENIRNIRNGLTITRKNLQASSRQFSSKIQQVPVIERQLLEINRQQGIKQELYLFLLQKREEAALSLSATVSDIRLIDDAIGTDKPVKPKKIIILLAAFVIGLALPLAFIHVKLLLSDKIQHRKDVEQATAVPVIGEIAHNYSKNSVAVNTESNTPIAELFHLLRSNLVRLGGHKLQQVLLVTSNTRDEGRKFISLNLGASLALTGKKVVILELDLRKPALLQSLQLPAAPGVTEYLNSSTLTAADITSASPLSPDLYLIGSRTPAANPAQLITSPRIGKLIAQLRDKFDYVIIISPPVGEVADAYALAPFTDSTLFVVRYNVTAKEQLAAIQDIYLHKKLNTPMIVLNDAKKENGYNAAYGHVGKAPKS